MSLGSQLSRPAAGTDTRKPYHTLQSVSYVPYAPYGIIRSVRTVRTLRTLRTLRSIRSVRTRPLLTYRSTEPGEARKLLQLATHSAAYGVTAVFYSQ